MTISANSIKVLDREYLSVRAKLIDLAASLDRIQRGGESMHGDQRIDKIRQAAQILAAEATNRTEQIQRLFSLSYDEHWQT